MMVRIGVRSHVCDDAFRFFLFVEHMMISSRYRVNLTTANVSSFLQRHHGCV